MVASKPIAPKQFSPLSKYAETKESYVRFFLFYLYHPIERPSSEILLDNVGRRRKRERQHLPLVFDLFAILFQSRLFPRGPVWDANVSGPLLSMDRVGRRLNQFALEVHTKRENKSARYINTHSLTLGMERWSGEPLVGLLGSGDGWVGVDGGYHTGVLMAKYKDM